MEFQKEYHHRKVYNSNVTSESIILSGHMLRQYMMLHGNLWFERLKCLMYQIVFGDISVVKFLPVRVPLAVYPPFPFLHLTNFVSVLEALLNPKVYPELERT